MRNNENGLISILVATAIVTVVSLIVLGFSAIMRRESRQVLDHQLSTQALYAAESALNAKVSELRAAPDPHLLTNQTVCSPEFTFASNPEFARSTCVLVEPHPNLLEYTDVTTDKSTVVLLRPASGQTFQTLTIKWGSKTDRCLTTGYEDFPGEIDSQSIGMLRIDLTETGSTVNNRQSLVEGTFSAILHPRLAGSIPFRPFGTDMFNQTPMVFGTCVDGSGATATIIGLSGTGPYLLRIRGVYKPSNVVITASNGSGPGNVNFIGAQAVVDSTARVQDVVRRVRARVPIGRNGGLVPDYALRTTDSICKLVSTRSGSSSIAPCP